MADQLGIGTDQIASLGPRRGQRVLDRVRDLGRRNSLAAALVEEPTRLIQNPLVALPPDVVERALDVVGTRFALVPDRGLHLARLDERHLYRRGRARELLPLRFRQRLERVFRRAIGAEPGRREAA